MVGKIIQLEAYKKHKQKKLIPQPDVIGIKVIEHLDYKGFTIVKKDDAEAVFPWLVIRGVNMVDICMTKEECIAKIDADKLGDWDWSWKFSEKNR